MTRTQELLTTMTAIAVSVATWRWGQRHESLVTVVLPWALLGAAAVFLARPGGRLAGGARRALRRAANAQRRAWLRFSAVAAGVAILAAAAWAFPALRHEWRERAVAHFYGPGHNAYTETVASRYALLWAGMQVEARYAASTGVPPGLRPNLGAWIDGAEGAHLKAFSPPELKTMRDADDKAKRLRAAGRTDAEIAADFDEDAFLAAKAASPEERAAAATWRRVHAIADRTGLPEDVVAARLDEVAAAAAHPDFDRIDYLLALGKTRAQ